MKTIIFLECNISGTGVRGIKLAEELGYQTVLFTKEKAFYQTVTDNPTLYVDNIVELNTDCISTIINYAMNYDTHGIVAFDDYRIITAAAASHALGLPSPNIRSLIVCRYKNRTREVLFTQSDNFKYRIFNIDDEVNISGMKFPLVVKPCDDSGSSKVVICHNLEMVNSAIQDIKLFRTNSRGYKLSSNYLIEEFITGEEYSAEAYWDSDLSIWKILGFTKKHTTQGMYSVEIGHDFPCQLDSSNKIEQVIIGWLNKIELSHTVVHVEFKLNENHVSLIEINPRVAGGMIDNLCLLSIGFDLVHCYLSQVVKSMEYKIQRKLKQQSSAIRFLITDRQGTITKIQTHFSLNKPIIYQFVPTPITVGKLKDSYGRLGYVITTADTLELAAKTAEDSINNIEMIYR